MHTYTSMSSVSSNSSKESTSQIDNLENEIRLKYEDKIKYADQRRDHIQNIDNEKKGLVRTRHDNNRKPKMSSKKFDGEFIVKRARNRR